MWRISWQVFDAGAFNRRMMEVGRKSIEMTARQAPLDQTRRIEARLTPQDTPQKANEPATAKRKRERLGHDIPLRETGRLGQPELWRVEGAGDDWTVSPPVDRSAIIAHLKRRGYRLLEISQALRDYQADVVEAGLAEIKQSLRVKVQR